MNQSNNRGRYSSLSAVSARFSGTSMQPSTLGKILAVLIGILIMCNIFTLYLLNETINAKSNCDNESSTVSLESLIENHHQNPNEQQIHNQGLSPATNPIAYKEQREKTVDQLPFLPKNLNKDGNNYQNPNGNSISNDEKNANSNTNNNKKSNSNNNNDDDDDDDDNSNNNNNNNNEKFEKTNEYNSDSTVVNEKKRQKSALMPGIANYDPPLPSYSEILKKNRANQEHYQSNDELLKKLTNKNLWKSSTFDNNKHKSVENDYINKNKNKNNEYCDWTSEIIFNNTLEIYYSNLKKTDYMPLTICPDEVGTGWRGNLYVPFIHGSDCEPWWHRDAVFIVSRLLHPNMKALEWGSGASTLWMSRFVKYIIAVEYQPTWASTLTNITNYLGIDNLEVLSFNLGRKYVEIDFSNNPGGITDWERNDEDKTGGIDFISNDGSLRYPCMEYAFKYIKPHGGIILLDNSDRPGNDGYKVTKLMPDHWLRFDSSNLERHTDRLTNKRWLKNSQSTIYITRDKRCM